MQFKFQCPRLMYTYTSRLSRISSCLKLTRSQITVVSNVDLISFCICCSAVFFLVSFSWLTEKIIEFRCRFRYPRWWHSNNHPSLSRNYHFTRQLLTNSHATSTTIVMTREKKNTIFLHSWRFLCFINERGAFFPLDGTWGAYYVWIRNRMNEWIKQRLVH